jgi:hypothetical protein
VTDLDLGRYYDESIPPSLIVPPGPPATGATAGIPGSWTPPGSVPPASVADLMAGVPNAVVASPATAWTAGQFVQTRTTGAAGRATWTGAAWVGGVAPTATPSSSWTKAAIVAWLLDHGVSLSEEALASLTKAELLALAADLLDDEDGEAEALPPPEVPA